MLASISPVGEAARHQRWTITVTAYLVASTAGGAVVGSVAGTLGWLVFVVAGTPATAHLAIALATAGLLAVVIDNGLLPLRLPSWHRQVDEHWLTRYRGWVYGAGFGAQLGGAVFTRIPTAVTHLWLLAAAATASPLLGALVGSTFGLVRAAPLLLTVQLRDPVRLNRFHARMEHGTRAARRGTGVAVLLAVAATVVAAG